MDHSQLASLSNITLTDLRLRATAADWRAGGPLSGKTGLDWLQDTFWQLS